MKENNKSLHSGHRGRLREIVNNTDATNLPEHQILELLLTYVLPQKDVNPLAHELLNEFGSLANVFDANINELMKVNGVGEVLASFLSFCSKLPEIYYKSRADSKRKLVSARDIIKFLQESIACTSIEKFYYLCLSAKGEVLCLKSLGSGSISQLYINNRELVQQILKYPTQSVVVCHTHPHGVLKPSDNDIIFTNNLKNILDSLYIRLCDHLIFSSEGYFSFFQHKMLGYEMENKPFGKLKTTMLNTDQFIYAIKDEDFPSNTEFNKFKK